MSWKQFGNGILVGVLLSAFFLGTAEWITGEGAKKTGPNLDLPQEDIPILRRENQNLRARLEKINLQIRERNQEAARQPSAKRESLGGKDSEDTATSQTPMERFLEKYGPRAPLPEVDLNLELASSLMVSTELDNLPEHRGKILALLQLHKDHPENLNVIAKFLFYGNPEKLFEDRNFAEQVRSSLEDWARKYPDSAVPSLWLGRIVLEKGNAWFAGGDPQTVAETWFLETLNRDPGEGRASGALAQMYKNRGEVEKAFRYGDQAVQALSKMGSDYEIDAEKFYLGLELGGLSAEMSDIPRASHYFEIARQVSEEAPNFRNHGKNWVETSLGLLSLQSGSVEQAVEHLRLSGMIRGDYTVKAGAMKLELTEALIHRGIYVETKEYLQRLLELTSEDSETYRGARKLLVQIP